MQLRRLRARAHRHTEKCRAPASRVEAKHLDEIDPRYICGMREDHDLADLLAAFDHLVMAGRRAFAVLHPTSALYSAGDMSAADREAQRRSFAYGNVVIENPRVTRGMIDRAAEELAASNSDPTEVD